MAEAANKRLRKDFKNLQVYSKVGMQIFFVSPHISNLQICKEKSSVSDPDPQMFAVNIFFYLRKYILDYEIPCNSLAKMSQKPKVVLKFE
jgi:hypothetical protein